MDGNEWSIVGTTMLGHAFVHTYELSIPLFIPVWLEQFSIAPSTMGFVVGAGYALFGLGSLPAGALADIYESKPLIALCFLGMSVAFLLVSLAPTLVAVAVALLVWGAAASLYHPAGLSLLSRSVERRGKALGYHGIAGNVGIALGPFVTIVLLAVADWRTAAAVLALPGLLAGPAVWRLTIDENRAAAADGIGDDPVVPSDDSYPFDVFTTYVRTTFRGAFVVVFAIVVFEGLYYRSALTFLPDLLDGFSTFDPVRLFGQSISSSRYLYVYLLTVGIVGQYLGGAVADRVDPTFGVGVTYAGLAAVALAFIPAAEAGVVPLLVVGTLFGIMLFGEQPLLQATVAEYSTADARGISYGFMYVGVFGVGALGTAITGFLLTYAGATTLFGFLALLGVGATLTSFAVFWRTRDS